MMSLLFAREIDRYCFRMPASFGDWLRQKREDAQVSQRQLALQIGAVPATVSKTESGKVGSSREMALQMIDALGASRDEGIRVWLEDPRQHGGAVEVAGMMPVELSRESVIDLSQIEGYEELDPELRADVIDDITVAVERARIKQRRRENIGGSSAGRN